MRLRQIAVGEGGVVNALTQFKRDEHNKTTPPHISTIKKWRVLILAHVIADFRGVGWEEETLYL